MGFVCGRQLCACSASCECGFGRAEIDAFKLIGCHLINGVIQFLTVRHRHRTVHRIDEKVSIRATYQCERIMYSNAQRESLAEPFFAWLGLG